MKYESIEFDPRAASSRSHRIRPDRMGHRRILVQSFWPALLMATLAEEEPLHRQDGRQMGASRHRALNIITLVVWHTIL